MLASQYRRPPRPDDPQELIESRHRNDRRLKRKFENIFEKYSRDFSETGDEINLTTGQVVVDNGHLTQMRHETDVGSHASRRFLRAFTQELGSDEVVSNRNGQHRQPYGSAYQMENYDESSAGNEDEDSEDELQGTHSYGNLKEKSAITSSYNGSTAMTSRATGHQQQVSTMPKIPIDTSSVANLGQTLAQSIVQFLNQQMTSQMISAPSRNDPWAVPALPTSYNPITPFSSRMMRQTEELRSASPAGQISLWASYEDDGDMRRIARKRPNKATQLECHIGSATVPRASDRTVISYGKDMEFVDQSRGSTPEIIENMYDAYDSDVQSIHSQSHDGDFMDIDSTERHDTPEEQDALDHIQSNVGTSTHEIDYTEFMRHAQHNFQSLAHGVVNRGYLRDKEMLSKTKARKRLPKKVIKDKQQVITDMDELPDPAQIDGIQPNDQSFVQTAPMSTSCFRAEITIPVMSSSHEKPNENYDADDPEGPYGKSLPRFTKQEDAFIIRLKENRNLHWSQIAKLLPGRSEGSISVRYNRTLKWISQDTREAQIEEIFDDEEEDAAVRGILNGASKRIPTTKKRDKNADEETLYANDQGRIHEIADSDRGSSAEAEAVAKNISKSGTETSRQNLHKPQRQRTVKQRDDARGVNGSHRASSSDSTASLQADISADRPLKRRKIARTDFRSNQRLSNTSRETSEISELQGSASDGLQNMTKVKTKNSRSKNSKNGSKSHVDRSVSHDYSKIVNAMDDNDVDDDDDRQNTNKSKSVTTIIQSTTSMPNSLSTGNKQMVKSARIPPKYSKKVQENTTSQSVVCQGSKETARITPPPEPVSNVIPHDETQYNETVVVQRDASTSPHQMVDYDLAMPDVEDPSYPDPDMVLTYSMPGVSTNSTPYFINPSSYAASRSASAWEDVTQQNSPKNATRPPPVESGPGNNNVTIATNVPSKVRSKSDAKIITASSQVSNKLTSRTTNAEPLRTAVLRKVLSPNSNHNAGGRKVFKSSQLNDKRGLSSTLASHLIDELG